jgi:hypothetical protein
MMMKKTLTLVALALVVTSTGCAYRYYLGLHGPTIRSLPDIHTEVIKDDAQCLKCHGAENTSGEAPSTSHPGFKGCLKCHNDPLG